MSLDNKVGVVAAGLRAAVTRALIQRLNSRMQSLAAIKWVGYVASLEGFEPPTRRLEGACSIP